MLSPAVKHNTKRVHTYQLDVACEAIELSNGVEVMGANISYPH